MEEKKLRLLRATALVMGIAGSVIMLHSLLMVCFSYTDPAAGNTAISMFHYLDVKMTIAFGLLEMSIVFSLLGFAVPQILVGSFTGLWAGFICRDILRGSAEMNYSGVNLGFGMYMFILSAVLFVASGIVLSVTANKQKAFGMKDRKPALFRKLEVVCSIMLGLSMVIFSILEVVKH